MKSKDNTFLYQNGVTTVEYHVFTGDDVFGQYQYLDELGLEIFTNGNAGTNSAVYHFPIGSTEADPGNSLSGMWMRIVLDFN